ncbi:DNA polymerase-4/DNA polymerase V [Streptohalobacillus salinus]|uniref:DNA polymerase IV n=1 Tax=Streptohalobacillus salinus TaxID=621096 RepID=A0A2V3VZ52_9BACI|nr:DNA polymerase-4/DNA polymerase V [Streptohalobacillus salinus]
MKRIIFLVDMQSFYASVEKVKNPRLKHRPVVVAGDPKLRSGIILAACPLAKKQGVKTAEAIWQAEAKCPDMVVVKPNMALYIQLSYQITRILERFSDMVEVYSIDEQFVDVTHSLHLFGTKEEMAKQIHDEILETLGIESRIGIGENKVLAKMACDHFAKKRPTGVFELKLENIAADLWPLSIDHLFGVGARMRKHFVMMGLHTIGNLANYPVKFLKKRWGINGEVLWRFANGIDTSPVSNQTHRTQKTIGHAMTLPYDYLTAEDIKVVLSELAEEVARRVRKQGYLGEVVSLSLRGHRFDVNEGFHRQRKLAAPTQLHDVIYDTACALFDAHWTGVPVRSVGISLGQLEKKEMRQLSFFDDPVEQEQLAAVIDRVKETFGPTSIIRASSLTGAGQAHNRAKKIGGHTK